MSKDNHLLWSLIKVDYHWCGRTVAKQLQIAVGTPVYYFELISKDRYSNTVEYTEDLCELWKTCCLSFTMKKRPTKKIGMKKLKINGVWQMWHQQIKRISYSIRDLTTKDVDQYNQYCVMPFRLPNRSWWNTAGNLRKLNNPSFDYWASEYFRLLWWR